MAAGLKERERSAIQEDSHQGKHHFFAADGNPKGTHKRNALILLLVIGSVFMNAVQQFPKLPNQLTEKPSFRFIKASLPEDILVELCGITASCCL